MSEISDHEKQLPQENEIYDAQTEQVLNNDPDAEFGGHEARKIMERKLLWKLDARLSILVIIYILNYVREGYHKLTNAANCLDRSTGIMHRQCQCIALI